MTLKELSLSHRQISLTKRKKLRRKVALPRNYELQSGGKLQKVTMFEGAEGQSWHVFENCFHDAHGRLANAFHIQSGLYHHLLHRRGRFHHGGLSSILRYLHCRYVVCESGRVIHCQLSFPCCCGNGTVIWEESRSRLSHSSS